MQMYRGGGGGGGGGELVKNLSQIKMNHVQILHVSAGGLCSIWFYNIVNCNIIVIYCVC